MARRSLQDLLGPFGDEASPRTATAAPSRVSVRGDTAMVGGAHEGASRISRELALWQPPLRSADADIIHERDTADARARDSRRNDSYVQGAENLHRDGIVGAMFMLQAKPNLKVLRLDETWEKEFQEEAEAKFTLYAESPDNWIDASRMNTLTGLVRLAIGVYLYSGEILATSEWMRGPTRRPYQTAIQMIEVDRLCNPFGALTPQVLENGNILVGGIEKDRFGAPVGYHIRDSHPADLRPNSVKWTRFPKELYFGRLRVLHILEQTRIDQTRGISEMVSALKEMRITKKFRDIVLQNAVVNATYAASIESDLPRMEALETIGAGEGIGDHIVDYMEAYLSAVAEFTGASKNIVMDGVKIPHLPPGSKLQLRPAGTAGPLGTEFESSLLRYIAAALGVSYEQLSRDYSKTNYSSARAAMLETRKFMSARKRMIADRFATHCYRLWLEEAVNKGEMETMKGRPDFYEGMNKDAYTACEWLGAEQGQVDELKETQAAVLKLKYNLTTLADEHGKQGKDWRKQLAQRSREVQEEERLDIAPPEKDANMENAASGAPRQQGDE